MRRGVVVVFVLLALGAPACGRGEATPQLGPGEGIVAALIDGDTMRVRMAPGEESVRLIGIDTPETHGRGGLRECFGKEASARLARLTPVGTRVRLERDVEPRDRYGRLLAYVYRVSDDLFVNVAMAREGYAAPLTIPPNVTFTDRFVDAAAEAREANRGLWGKCGSADVPI